MRQQSFLSHRKKLTVCEAARVMAEEFGGKVGEAEALIVEAIEEGDLPADVVRWETIDDQWEGIPRQGNINSMETTVNRADLDVWITRQLLASPKSHDGQEERVENTSEGRGMAKRQDALSLELTAVLAEMAKNGEGITPVSVMQKLKARAGKGGCIIDSAAPNDGVIWERSRGASETLTIDALEARLRRIEAKSRR